MRYPAADSLRSPAEAAMPRPIFADPKTDFAFKRIFGSEDQIYDEDKALAAYDKVPGAETHLVDGAGHSPNVEKPGQTAALVLAFESKLGPVPSGKTATATGRAKKAQPAGQAGKSSK